MRDMSGERHVLAGALSRFDLQVLREQQLSFAEAGPRKMLLHKAPTARTLNVAILVSGGIAPGINAVIAGIVERHCRYANSGGYGHQLTVHGVRSGFEGLLSVEENAWRSDLVHPGPVCSPAAEVGAHANEGGSFLGTSRLPDFAELPPDERGHRLRSAVTAAVARNVKVLYVIGGDGSMKAAHALQNTARAMNKDLAVVGIPKTIDNDILWAWTSFGFQSAVQQSTEAVRQLWTEASSNPRLCVIQLFGSDSGFVVTDAAAASGKCDLFLIPEQAFTMDGITDHLTRRLLTEHRAYGVVLMAETSIPLDVARYIYDPDDPAAPDEDRELLRSIELTAGERQALRKYEGARHLIGPTPDALRSGALKVVSRVLLWKLQARDGSLKRMRVVTNEPRHLIRAIAPSSSDIIFARRLANLAVDGAMAGFRDFMISQWLTEYVMVPLRLVVLGRKRIPTDGAFYASARASTGQPSNLGSRVEPPLAAGEASVT
jgi:6-phosphofructokinase 1